MLQAIRKNDCNDFEVKVLVRYVSVHVSSSVSCESGCQTSEWMTEEFENMNNGNHQYRKNKKNTKIKNNDKGGLLQIFLYLINEITYAKYFNRGIKPRGSMHKVKKLAYKEIPGALLRSVWVVAGILRASMQISLTYF